MASVTVEMNVVVTAGKEGEGGFDIKVISFGGKKSYEEQQVHKITVELAPLTRREQSANKYLEDLLLKVDKMARGQPG